MDLEDAKVAAKQGAAWLDEYMPCWFEVIDLDRLEMDSVFNCVMGQTHGQYGPGLEKLADALGCACDAESLQELAVEGGFNTPGDFAVGEAERAFVLLDEAWLEQIEERKGQ